MGDSMDMPCGFSNEGKSREIILTITSKKVNPTNRRKLFGQSTLNDFMGWYTILSFDEKTKTGKIQFETLVSTKMASDNASLIECEKRYLSYLEKMVDFKIEDEKLQLSITFNPLNGNIGIDPFAENYKICFYLIKKMTFLNIN